MRFSYTASKSSGEVVRGDIEAPNSASVLEWMVRQGLKPVSIKAAGGVESGKLKKRLAQKITVEDKVFLTKYLALMLRVGTDLFSAIDILIADFDKPAIKSLLVEMKDTLGKGQKFYTTFAKYPKYFSNVFVSIVKAGEASGNLDNVFEGLSVDVEKEWALRNRIRGSLVYPVVLVSLSLIILFLMVTFALPKIAETFITGTVEPPTFSKIVFSISLFLRKYIVIISTLFVGSAVGGWFFIKSSVAGKRFVSRFITKVPVVKNVVFKMSLQRFAKTFASLLRSGMPILESIETTADAVGSGELRNALLRISRDGIAKGLTIGEAFRKEPYFPRVVVNLIAVSEKAGHLEEMLETLAEFYESETDTSVKALVTFLEPALLIVIGLVVGVIALSIIIPIYQLVGTI